MKTKVIFRKYCNGQIIALFPELGDEEYCDCYSHIGQHSNTEYHYTMSITQSSTGGALKSELEQMGYDLIVCQKMSHKMYHRRATCSI